VEPGGRRQYAMRTATLKDLAFHFVWWDDADFTLRARWEPRIQASIDQLLELDDVQGC